MNRTFNLNGREIPIVGMIETEQFGLLPVLDLPQMSDYQWQLNCLNDRLEHPDEYEGRENVPEVVAKLRKWLEEHAPAQAR